MLSPKNEKSLDGSKKKTWGEKSGYHYFIDTFSLSD